jgi:hypothetical protein
VVHRETAVRNIAVGDIFNSRHPAGPVRICLALSVTTTTIQARSIMTQEIFEFDRRSGAATLYGRSLDKHLVIDSVEPLPDDIREIMLGLDRKGREYEYKLAEKPDWWPSPDESSRTEDEIRGLGFVSDFYRRHKLRSQ